MEIYIITFIPIWIILLLIFFGVGAVYKFLTSLSMIIFVVCFFAAIFYGFVIIAKAISRVKKDKDVVYLITELFRGIYVTVLLLFVYMMLQIACGDIFDEDNIANVQFMLIGSIGKHSVFSVCTVLSLVILIVVSIPVWISKNIKNRMLKSMCQITSIIFMVLICIIFFQYSMKNEMINAEERFNWESPEYMVDEKTDIKHEVLMDNLIKTGKFSVGTKLYASGITHTTNDDILYVEVTDGEEIGYVCKDDLQVIVDYFYYINYDTEIYNVDYKKYNAYSTSGSYQVDVPYATNEVIGYVTEGEQVTYGKYGDSEYKMIITSSGIKGLVKADAVEEVRSNRY